MNFFNAGIPLGRWFGVSVSLHYLFIVFVGFNLLSSQQPAIDLLFYTILFGIVLIHEFGHCLACRWVGGVANQIILWPLGGLAFVQPPPRPWPSLITTVGGPITHVFMLPILWAIYYWGLPFLIQTMPHSPALPYIIASVDSAIRINLMLLIFNLIPAYPMDGGRILQEIIWIFSGYPASLHVAGMVGTVAGAILALLGMGLFQISIPWIGFTQGAFTYAPFPLGDRPNTMLIIIGALAAFNSWSIYQQSNQIYSHRRR